MKNKIFKTSVILLMILSMTMTNFIFVGSSLISYAADNSTTNHKNVEFKAYFKNEEGNEVTTLEQLTSQEETFLYLQIGVKKEGYFNGEISLKNTNFQGKESDSSYVNKIENNTIYLNQINAGTTEEIKVKVEPMKEENFQLGFLNMINEVELKGIYRDSTQKDISIQANQRVAFKMVENNQEEEVQNELKLITNKMIEMQGEEKRILQFAYTMGLKQNNYPIEKIEAILQLPENHGKALEIEKVEYLNNMKELEAQYEGNQVKLVLNNKADEEGKINWKAQGNETIILTVLYDVDVKIENAVVKAQEKVTLYDGKEIGTEEEITIGEEEIDSIVEAGAKNSEEVIYKGKLNAGIDKNYQSVTQIRINYAKVIPEIEIEEGNTQYAIGERREKAHVIFYQTKISKEKFETLFGNNGKITIYDQDGEERAIITNDSPVDAEGNIVVVYEGKEVQKITLKTTAPVEEGTLEIDHEKTIKGKEEQAKIKEADGIKDTIIVNGKEIQTILKLENTTTKATLEVDKESLSTVVGNNVEIKAILTSNDEKYDLYKNPEITIELPEQVENINMNSMDLLYENELKIKDYAINGRTIKVSLEGEQTNYKEAVEGAAIVMNTTIAVDKKATTADEQVKMTYQNEETGDTSKAIRIVAPKDVTPIYTVQGLGIETIGQEPTKQVTMPRGVEEKTLEAQMEIINNKEVAIQNVKILGDFPTNREGNNMAIEILGGITMLGVENAKIYYTTNSQATDRVEDSENGWTETIANASQVSKYLIVIDRLEVGSRVQGTYSYKVPANLDYNQTAKTGYQVKYTDSINAVESKIESTTIEMQTGMGPHIETKLTATVGGKAITGTVKNGEVIKYTVQIANTGSEVAQNVSVVGQVPEGTTMVLGKTTEDGDYYEEVDHKQYEEEIEMLEAGQVVYKEYEVRVNAETTEGTRVTNQAEVTYGDVTKQTNENMVITEKGYLRVGVKRATYIEKELYSNGVVEYAVVVKNISGQKQENVKIKAEFSDNITPNAIILYSGLEEEDKKNEILEYHDEINVGTFEVGEMKILYYGMMIGKVSNHNDQISFSATVTDGTKTYQANEWKDKVKYAEVEMEMTSNPTDQYVKAGDTIEYTITVKNKLNFPTAGLEIVDAIPSQLTVKKITRDGEIIEEAPKNNIRVVTDIEAEATTVIKIETVVNYSQTRKKAEAITNVAHAVVGIDEEIATTSEITHIIQANENGGNTDPETPGEDDENKVDDNDIANGKKSITGLAWYDANANGKKEQEEETLKGIKVKLLNAETNHFVKEEDGTILEAITNENGIYVLDKIGNGKYIVVFDYDKTQYALTKYRVDGVTEAENSNAIVSDLQIEGQKQEVTATDILELQNNHIANINIGFIKRQNFDLKLDKYVSRILVQNAKGTTVREYNNETIAKVELDAKTVNGSTILVEYKIQVTNVGEVEGYAKKIADYASTELKFSSELNKNWYQTGDTLYTTALANEKIMPGETKTVTLTLTKTVTENSGTGLIPNTAEIAEDYNELGIPDSNSTPGNRAKGENDMGAAEVVLSIKTGGMIYTTIGVASVIVLGMMVLIMMKKKNKQDNE